MSSAGVKGGDPLKDLERLVEDFRQSGLRELHARAGDLEIYLSQDPNAIGLDGPKVSVSTAAQPAQVHPAAAPTAAPAAPAAAPKAAGAAVPEGASVVVAPYLGTFYRAPKPGAPAYVEIGAAVTAETELCLVEVMKLFTAVRAGVSGTVVAILAGDGDLVQAGQPLFAVKAG
ncbi:acetyl-CoA carboxylase biotin carboxyl carrier protein [Novosphingobium sp. KCTC 2891]|uniref:acetyl-CoA carboxylase biotin carboxyl carrier protein n=1 Tax=Novosphingobium sp. KCTC 2891 TaxID=2989730 RepID=UPI0022218717|nr:acetyl-CoA carboxylase biotin carboxyl carrier protein [Novosphingobium sp. KCTC 2891]MCW1384942.1 acetyl-CoA carboxylase biotin carboxyl carrier protein [Novosphingobium sp. KCTC 2891]